jgi:hypothetical protein
MKAFSCLVLSAACYLCFQANAVEEFQVHGPMDFHNQAMNVNLCIVANSGYLHYYYRKGVVSFHLDVHGNEEN